MLAPPALRTSRTCPSSARRLLSRSCPRARPFAHVHAHMHVGVRANTHTHIHVYACSRFTFPLCFPFPSSSFPLVALQHLCLILVSLSSFAVNESLYLPFFLLLRVPFVFLSPFFSGPSADPSVPFSSRLPPMHPSLSDTPFSARSVVSRTRSTPRWRNFQPLQRQPNKCLSDYLHRRFSATLS